MVDEISIPDIGKRLRMLRQRKGYSQRALAQACELSSNAIGLIERNECSPSVSTLYQLSLILKVPLAEFFSEKEEKSVVLVKKQERQQTQRKQIVMEKLVEGLVGQEMEPYLVTLAPGAGAGAESVNHFGEEFVYCLEGEVVYRIGERQYTLESGDSMIFLAQQPHCWCNFGEEPARLLLIFHPGAKSETWWRQHLNQQT